jgi:hypothetical protein
MGIEEELVKPRQHHQHRNNEGIDDLPKPPLSLAKGNRMTLEKFVRCQELMENARKMKINKIMELEFEAQANKRKLCIKCRAIQSFDEATEEKK